jgi:hypothetical protein
LTTIDLLQCFGLVCLQCSVANPHANKLTIHILATVAEHEREAISERTDAKAIANASTNPAAKKTIGIDVRTLKDSTGKVFGKDLYEAAKEGQITEVSYMFPKPGTDMTPVPKVSFVTKVGDLGCGVGYYK